MLDELCSGHIADIGEGDPVAKGGHAVSTAGTGVSAGQRRELKVRSNVVHPALHIGQGQAQGGTRRGHMLEGSGGGQSSCFFQFFY